MNHNQIKEKEINIIQNKISKHDEINIRHQHIIKLLLQNEVSKEQLIQELNITIPTLKNDIKFLREQLGCKIESHKGILSLKNKELFSVQQEQITYDDIQQLLMLYVLNNKPTKFTNIRSSELFKSGTDNEVTDYSLRKYLKSLREHSLVYLDSYTYNNISELYFFSLPEKANELFELALYCLSLKDIPLRLYNNTIHCLANIGNSIIHAKTNSTLYKLSFYIDKLRELNYQKDALSFKYSKSNNSNKNITFFYVGLIIYSFDKDVLYILGREKPTKQSYIICRADRIDWDSLCSANNKSFQDKLNNDNEFKEKLKKEFEEIKLEMFDISADKKEYVKIKLDYSIETEYEIKNLATKRKHTSRIFYESNTGNIYTKQTDIPQKENITYIIYSDTIRGLGSFSNYIRKFGDKITVLENETLRKQLLTSANRVLENYS